MAVLQLTSISIYVLITVIGVLAITYSGTNVFFGSIAKMLVGKGSLFSTGLVGLMLSGVYLASSMALRLSGVQTGFLSTTLLILAAVLTGVNLGQTCFGLMELFETESQTPENPEEG